MHRLADDERCSASHVALYYALFYYWNRNRFNNPISISRDSIQQMAHIGSTKIYYRCIKDLDAWAYIAYMPSHSLVRLSKVTMIRFDPTDDPTMDPTYDPTGDITHDATCDTTDDLSHDINPAHNGAPLINSINNKNNLNKTNTINAYEQARDSDLHYDDTAAAADTESAGTTKAERRRKPGAVPDTVEEVAAYFEEKNSTRAEAEKFYDYFESNGWRIGGRAPMKNWRAAARGWITNIPNYNNGKNSKPQPFKPQLTGPKNYAEPF